MKQYLLVLLLLLNGLVGPVSSQAQTRYKATMASDGVTQIVRKESVPGTGVFDVVVSRLPSDAVRAKIGGRTLLPYAPEAVQTFNPSQFGSGKYYSPSFGFSVDFNPGSLTPAQRKLQGVNLFNFWSVSLAEKQALAYGDGMLYLTENGLHGPLEGAGYYESSLAQYEAYIRNTMPACGYGDDAGAKLLVFNIEQSNGWGRGNYGANSHWPSWASSKDKVVTCESDGVVRTLEQIDNLNLWDVETQVRRANRLIIAFKVARDKGKPGLKIIYGASMYQGLPRLDFQNNGGIFQPGNANVTFINSGAGSGNITLNGRSYTGVSGSHWSQEDAMNGYYYLFNFDISRADYNDIWVNKLAGTQNYPYIWSKIKLRHIVADEKGFLQLNRARMMSNQGSKRGILRMQEPIYEADAAGVVDGTFPAEIHRIPFVELQPNVTGNSEAPKIQQPPYLNYSRYCVTRFMAGNDPGWGYYMFPADAAKVRIDLSATPYFNHHLHNYTALYQARADMQPYETFYTGSTLVEDPEVQLNQTGSFSAYDGTAAYNYSDGTLGTQKPAYMLRYKATSTGWRVVILGGMNQDWTAERTDIVRVPGALNNNQFRIKLRGPAAQVYEFSVKNTDTGQTYDALPVATPSWEKPGYAGRVGAATSTAVTPPTSNTASGLPVTATFTGLLSRYSYSTTNGGALQVRGAGATGVQMKIETISGSALTLSNGQNSSLPYNTPLGYGASGDPTYPFDWTLWGVPSVPIRLTFSQGGQSDNVVLTPTVGSNQPLTVTPGTTAPTTTTAVVNIPAFDQTIPTTSASLSSFVNVPYDGGSHTGNYITSADWADYAVTNAPIAGTYTMAVRYQTNYACSGCGLGTYIVNGGTPVNFPMDGAEGGTRNPTFSVALNAGTNTIRIQGNNRTFFQQQIQLTRAASTGVTTTTTTTGSTTTTTGTSTTYASSTVAAGTPLAGAFDWNDLSYTTIPGNYVATLESAQIRVDLDLKEGTKPDKGLAGGIRQFIDKATGNNTLNVPIYRDGYCGDCGFPWGTVNDGRSINECLYLEPQPWTFSGTYMPIGYNINETGDGSETPARLIAFRTGNGMLQTEIEPNQWDGTGLRTGDVMKKWVKVENNLMKVWYESTIARTNATGAGTQVDSKSQEAPCDYLNGNYTSIYFYNGDAPYTNGAVKNINLPSFTGMTSGATYLTENWVAGCDPNTGRCQGMILETPITQIGQFGDTGAFLPNGSAFSSTYIAWYPRMTLQDHTKWRHSSVFVVGTLSEIRAKAYEYTQSRRKTTPEFRFNQPGLQLWSYAHSTSPDYNPSGRTSWPVTWGSVAYPTIFSPAMALDGSIKKFYVRYKYTSGSRSTAPLYCQWFRARQSAGGSNQTALWQERFPEGTGDGPNYTQQVSLIADGQSHTVEFDMTNKPEWKNIINEIRFSPDFPGSAGETIDIEWISGSASGPSF